MLFSVSLVFSCGENPANHLRLGRQLRRLMAHHCTCEAGCRTNSACRHVNGAVTALCSPNSFRTTKRKEARLLDLNRPDEHQPRFAGPPAVPPSDPAHVTTPCQRAPPVSRDTRIHVRDDICAGFYNAEPTIDPNFRAGFRANLAAPVLPNSTRGRGQGRRQRGRGQGRGRGRGHGRGNQHQHAHPSTLGFMRNIGQSCYADAAVQGLSLVCIDQHLTPPNQLPVLEANLNTAMSNLCVARRDPTVGPLSPVPLLDALQPCLVQARVPMGPFTVEQMQCSGEFLTAILSQLQFEPHGIILTSEEGLCQICGNQQHQVKEIACKCMHYANIFIYSCMVIKLP